MVEKTPSMVILDPEDDRAYLAAHSVHAKLAEAIAQAVRKKPDQPLRLIAQIISPETYVEPPPGAAPPAEPATAPAGDEAAA